MPKHDMPPFCGRSCRAAGAGAFWVPFSAVRGLSVAAGGCSVLTGASERPDGCRKGDEGAEAAGGVTGSCTGQMHPHEVCRGTAWPTWPNFVHEKRQRLREGWLTVQHQLALCEDSRSC